MSLASNNPLFLALRQLYDSGRLTGVTPDLALDGHRLLAADDFDIDPLDGVQWREDGFSHGMSEWGGRMSRAVEEHRAELLANGTPDDDQAARELPQWFVNVADKELDDKQEYMARENHQYVYMMRAFAGFKPQRYVATMQEYSPRFLKPGTGEPEYSYTVAPEDRVYAPGGVNPGDAIPNHRILVGDGWTNELLGHWADQWTTRTARGEDFSEVVG